MSQPSVTPESPSESSPSASLPEVETQKPAERPPSYVKLAMRNMVRKGGTSIYHFALSAVGLMALLVGLAYLTR
jgi:Protein of unknown function (DUF3285)